MGGESSMYVEWREKVRTGFWWGSQRERDHFEVPGVNRNIILQWIFKMWNVGMAWIYLDQDRDTWQALVNVVMKLRIPEDVGNFLTIRRPVRFQEGLYCKEFVLE